MLLKLVVFCRYCFTNGLGFTAFQTGSLCIKGALGRTAIKLLGTQPGSSYMELCCPISKIADLFCVTIPGKRKRSMSLPETVAVAAGSEQLKLSEINTS